MLEIDQSSPEFALWQNVLHQANKDNAYYASIGEKKRTDFAGDFRSWKYFMTWLMLHDYKPGMEVRRKNQLEPFTSKNCELVCERGQAVEISVQAESLPPAEPQKPDDVIVEGKTLAAIASGHGYGIVTLWKRYLAGARTIPQLTYDWRPETTKIEGKSLEEIADESGIPLENIVRCFKNGATTYDALTRKAGGKEFSTTGSYRTSCGDKLEISREMNARLKSIYDGIRDRCYNPKKHNYMQYGGRGIKMCDEWLHSFVAFREWAVHHAYAVGLSIDRIDSDGNYEPSNCRWATDVEQRVNQRGALYKVLRMRTEDAREYLAHYPKRGIVTIIVRLDLMPPIDIPKEVDYET